MLTRTQKLLCAEMRIDGKSMGQIAGVMDVSRQAISDFFTSLSEKRLSAKRCPFVQFRRWFNNNNLTLLDLANEIGVPLEDLEKAIYLEEDNENDMVPEIAAKISEFSGIPLDDIKHNEWPRKRALSRVAPRRGQYEKILFPQIAEYLKEHDLSISAFATYCKMDYSAVYFAITTIPTTPVSQSKKRLQIAEAIHMNVDEAFAIERTERSEN